MPTASERKALLFLGVVACLGGTVRLMRAHAIPPPSPAARRALDARIASADTGGRAGTGGGHRRATAGARRGTGAAPKQPRPHPLGVTPKLTVVVHRAPPPSRLHRVDVDRATAAQLQSLPGIGPALAARIIAFRDSAGPFGSLARLQRVKGIGPAKARRLDTLVTFSGVPRP